MKIKNVLGKYGVRETAIVEVGEGFEVTVCQAAKHNQTYQAKLLKYQMNQNDPLQEFTDAETLFRHDVMFFIDVLLIGWEGLTDDDDNNVPFSRDNAIELFLGECDDAEDRASRRLLFYKLNAACFNESLFRLRQEKTQEMVKN